MAPGKQPGASFLSVSAPAADVFTAMEIEAVISAVLNGTGVWMAVPASPPLRMTVANSARPEW